MTGSVKPDRSKSDIIMTWANESGLVVVFLVQLVAALVPPLSLLSLPSFIRPSSVHPLPSVYCICLASSSRMSWTVDYMADPIPPIQLIANQPVNGNEIKHRNPIQPNPSSPVVVLIWPSLLYCFVDALRLAWSWFMDSIHGYSSSYLDH